MSKKFIVVSIFHFYWIYYILPFNKTWPQTNPSLIRPHTWHFLSFLSSTVGSLLIDCEIKQIKLVQCSTCQDASPGCTLKSLNKNSGTNLHHGAISAYVCTSTMVFGVRFLPPLPHTSLTVGIKVLSAAGITGDSANAKIRREILPEGLALSFGVRLPASTQ